MNIPKYSLQNQKVIYFFLAIFLIGGVFAFFTLPKKEDAPFVIKQATLITQYPGATPLEVEELVTVPIEREIQAMADVYKVKSESYFGISKITIEFDATLTPEQMPNKWDELRRKVLNIKPQLPTGCGDVMVNDDFGAVYGIYYGLVAEPGYSYSEMRDWANEMKMLLSPVEGVDRVTIYGEQTEVVKVKISPAKMAAMNINPDQLKLLLAKQNTIVNSGSVQTGGYELRLMANGAYATLDDIKNQLIPTSTGAQVRLGDIALVERGYYDPPTQLLRVDGKDALGIGVASGSKDDVVAVGTRVDEIIEGVKERLPLGMELVSLYPENVIANDANNGFIINLIESLVIVIAIIFLVMGTRAGWLIGSSLLFSVAGTLLLMTFTGEGLNRTSLAAFIIAMGMLVDNAIVVTDNAQIAVRRGVSRWQALIDGAQKPQWALAGATLIAVCSFLPLYLAPASVAEIVKPLFVVLALSLTLSWVFALTQTTTFGNFILEDVKPGQKYSDPYDTKFYNWFQKFLAKLIKYRYATVISVIAVLIISFWVMAQMPKSFFPFMSKPYFRADLVLPEGYGIHSTKQSVLELEEWLAEQPEITRYSISMGASPVRYYLASSAYGPMPNYANVLIEVNDAEVTTEVEERFYQHMIANFPDIRTTSSLFALSPVPDAPIDFAFIGHDIDTLAMLVAKAEKLIKDSCNSVIDIRNSWGVKVPVWQHMYSQNKGNMFGVTRSDVANAMSVATSGMPIGAYREGDKSLPILLMDENIGNKSLNDIKSLPVYSASGKSCSLEQVLDYSEIAYDYNQVQRYNRERKMSIQCSPARGGNTAASFNEVKALVETIELPAGYRMQYFGEMESQDITMQALAGKLPIAVLIMFITLLVLFPDSYRKSVLIMCMLPLMFIGVVLGLLLCGKSLDFFATLGLLGLIGMNIKNAIVLVDEIGIQLNEGVAPIEAVIQSTKTRIVPVSMSSGTTILGMIPLLADSMFGGMAATIMGGLLASTLLTILVLPVCYCIFFKIKS